MAQGEESTSRFWEFYALRYSVGAVLGALILFFFIRQDPSLSSLIFVKAEERIDLVQVGIFVGVGLLYSYLSSAPILVFHVGRFLLPKKATSFFGFSRKSGISYSLLCLAFPITFYFASATPLELKIPLAIAIFLAASLVFGQLFIVWSCLRQRSKLFLFYKLLAINRASSKGGMVESYRHMREHGNAFGIVFFEMMLAVFLFAATKYFSYIYPVISPDIPIPSTPEIAAVCGFVVLAWIFPASLVWLIGCVIEQDFVDS